jgi:3-isopropylmalate dehydratase small subunit
VKSFTQLTGYAAPFMSSNIDTDQLLPKQFMKTIVKSDLAKSLFYNDRYNSDGEPAADFILNKAPFNGASILVTGENFGCGSSREHAVWALDDFGVRCLIGISFGEIFAGNCSNNGLLTIILAPSEVAQLAAEASRGAQLTIDLPEQMITTPSGRQWSFDIDGDLKERLVTGRDEIAETLQYEQAIARFESAAADQTFHGTQA